MKVLLTGGTGFVGRHIADALLEAGHEVTALLRNVERGDDLLGRGVQLVRGDFFDKDSLKKALASMDAVIHLVGIIVETRGGGTFEQVHFEITRNIVNAAREAAVKKFVHMSALGAAADSLSNYHRTKFMAEEYVRTSGINYTIFKPSVIHGRGDAFVNMYAQMLRRSPFVPVIGTGRVRMQPVYVGDVAKMFVAALTDDRHNRKTYEVGGPEAMSFDEIVDGIARALGKKAVKIHLPVWFMRFVAAAMRVFMKKPLINKDQLIMLQMDNVCDTLKIKRDFAIDTVKFADGIKIYLEREK